MKRIRLLLVVFLLLLAFAGSVRADGGGDGQFVFGGSYVLESGKDLYGDLVVMGGTARVEKGATVHGSVVVMGGAATIAGTVTQDVTILGGSVHLNSTALVQGQVVTFGGSVSRDEGARVEGEIVEGLRMPVRIPRVNWWRMSSNMWSPIGILRQIAQAILTVLGLMALGVLVILLLPGHTDQVAKVILSAPAASVGVGLLSLIVLPILTILLVITCIGPFILVLAFGIAILFGWIAVGLVLGRKILESLQTKDVSPLVAVVVGVAVITLLSQVPCLGWLFALFAASLGLGAVILTRFGTTTYPWPSSTAGPAAPSLPSATPAEKATSDKDTEWHGNV